MNVENKKEWFAAKVWIAPQAVEAIEFALSEAGAGGTEYSTLGEKEIGATVCVTGYFDEQPKRENLEYNIKNSLRIYDLPPNAAQKIEFCKVENQDWLAEWKKHWRPTETEKFIIAPVWAEVENTEKNLIRIEPSMAFGTGTHETTRLCLRAIEENYRAGETFLDVGTGTGILTVAAVKTQGDKHKAKGKIVGCDTDFDAIKIAKENAEINNVADEIEFCVGSISEDMLEFDFVCANLTADVIIPLLPLLMEKSKRILVLSGILKEQESLVVLELKKFRFSDFKIKTDGEWISIEVRTNSNLKQK